MNHTYNAQSQYVAHISLFQLFIKTQPPQTNFSPISKTYIVRHFILAISDWNLSPPPLPLPAIFIWILQHMQIVETK